MDEKCKEVFFYKYCKTCKHEKTKDPCNECLDKYNKLYSNKPVKWEEKE